MIDTRDLPAAVRRTVAMLPAELDARAGAQQLRHRALTSWHAISTIWATEQWHQVHEQLGLVGGYLTAAQRLEEDH